MKKELKTQLLMADLFFATVLMGSIAIAYMFVQIVTLLFAGMR